MFENWQKLVSTEKISILFLRKSILHEIKQNEKYPYAEYIMFGSQQQLTKINLEPLQAGPDLMELSNKVKYLDGLLDSPLSFDQHVSSKVQKAMINFIKVKSVYKYITWEACTTLS